MQHLLTPLLSGVRSGLNIPLRLALWDGETHDLGSDPRVTVKLPGPGAIKYFVPPSLDNLAEGYVNGHFDVLGSAQDIVAAASNLAQSCLPAKGKFGRLFKTVQHNRTNDALAIGHHYNVSNDFYRAWLDPEMVYSCAYFPTATESLAHAQLAKLDHILRKIQLKPQEKLLDVGCGWGSLVIRAAKAFGARAVGITLSSQQYEWARERVAREGLTKQVEIRLLDYRDLNARDGCFDKITSVGMFEHVGLDHLQSYFSKMNSLLKDGGLILNHGITSTDPESGVTPLGAAKFIDKYVFPNGELPHISLTLKEIQAAGLEMLDVECMRRHYARTLRLWVENYENNSNKIRQIVDETTFRVWRIYLAGCALAFSQNWISLHQILACKAGADEKLNPTPWSRAYMYPEVS